MHKPFQIFSDGKEMAILMDDVVYVLSDPYMHSVSIDCSHNIIECGNIDGWVEFCPGIKRYSINLDINGGTLTSVPGKDFLLGFDVFNQKTIRELLGLVNRKIEQRK